MLSSLSTQVSVLTGVVPQSSIFHLVYSWDSSWDPPPGILISLGFCSHWDSVPGVLFCWESVVTGVDCCESVLTGAVPQRSIFQLVYPGICSHWGYTAEEYLPPCLSHDTLGSVLTRVVPQRSTGWRWIRSVLAS